MTERAALAPRSIEELAQTLLDHPEAVIVAGGTDVGLWVTKQHRTLPVTVSLDEVADLATIERNRRHNPDRRRRNLSGRAASAGEALPGLRRDDPPHRLPPDPQPRHHRRQHRQRLADRRHSHRLCWPWTRRWCCARAPGTAPSRWTTSSPATARQSWPQASSSSASTSRCPAQATIFRCYKVSKRFDQDISAVCAAFRLRLEDGVVRDIRIGFGGMAATPACAFAPWRTPWPAGPGPKPRPHGAIVLDASLAPLSDLRASAAYRRTVARNLLLKFFLETNDGGSRHPAGVGMNAFAPVGTTASVGAAPVGLPIPHDSAPQAMSTARRSTSTTCRNRQACCIAPSASARTPTPGSSRWTCRRSSHPQASRRS